MPVFMAVDDPNIKLYYAAVRSAYKWVGYLVGGRVGT